MNNLVTRSEKKSQELVTVRCDPAGKVLVTKDRKTIKTIKTIKWYNVPLQISSHLAKAKSFKMC